MLKTLPKYAFVLAALATAAAAVAAGRTLGLALGGLCVAAIFIPELVAGVRAINRQAATVGGAVGGIAVIWLWLIGRPGATLVQWCEIVALLASLGVALAAAVNLLRTAGMGQFEAAGLTILLALAWLTWPVWMSPHIALGGSEAWVQRAVRVSPPLVANGVLTFTPPWTEQRLAYEMTVLNQDVAVKLPDNPLPCILVHLAAAGILLSLAWGLDRLKSSNAKALTPQ